MIKFLISILLLTFLSSFCYCQPTYTLEALSFEKFTNIEGYVNGYQDTRRKCLAVNAGRVAYRDKYAAAQTTFKGKSGKYKLSLTTLLEDDGESTYKIKVNNKYIGEVIKNEVSEKNYKEQINPLPNKVRIKNGDTIMIEFMAVTNGKIPEGNGTAYARGRWRRLELTK
ncbi:hypothetical protein [Reichenbachiella versicolor]|uniref:hypothetical protein n=1 Tax=Reichenbachiella versicolor TaxID=1821036 RepID=UPI000D6E16DE|nr:hypothetical protein [Reichenbachiella versicolor]